MRSGTAIRNYEERILAYERGLAAPRASPGDPAPETRRRSSDPLGPRRGSAAPRHRAPDPRHRAPDPRHRAPDPRHRAPDPRHRPPQRRHTHRRRATNPLRFRVRRIAALITLLLVADVFVSFADAMLRPSNVGLGVRVVEWLRDNGAAGLVSDVEAIYYS